MSTNPDSSVNVNVRVTGLNGATVEFAIDDPLTVVATDATFPYQFVVPAGSHHLFARATKGATTVVDEWQFPIASSPCGRKQFANLSGYNHVVVVVMENKFYSQVIGDPAAPYLTGLANQCASATDYFQAGSPSRPNYLAMTSGGTQGCDGSNADPPSCQTTADNIFRQVIDAGGTAKSYVEGMNTNCEYGSHGAYATKHNPWPYFVGPNDQQYCQQFDIPMGSVTAGALVDDITNGTLPTLAYVVPDLCNDTHDCSVATGDAFLQQLLPKVLGGQNYRSGDTAVIVNYDEYSPLPNVWISPSVTPGARYTQPMSHYGFLRTVEEVLRLPLLGAAATAPSMRGPFNF